MAIKYDAAQLHAVRQKFLILVAEGWSPMYAMGLCGVKENTFRKYFRNDLPVQRAMAENRLRRQLLKRGP